MTDRLMKFQ